MPWTAIQYVGGTASLIAFLGALVAWVYRGRLKARENMIKSAPEAERAALVASALEFFHVSSDNLTRVQQYNLAIEQIRARAKRFLLVTMLIFLLARVGAGSVLYVTWIKRDRGPEAVPGFDIAIQPPQFYGTAKGVRTETPVKFFPVEVYATTTSTVFGGIVSIHDLDMMEDDTKHRRDKPCLEIPSCLAVKTFGEFAAAPLYVRASGDSEIIVNTSLELPRPAKTVVVLAEFYQRELGGGRRCVVDSSRPAPKGGTAFLKVVDKSGATTGEPCIGAMDRKVFKVALN